MACLGRGDEGDASTWQGMREETPFSSSYSAGDDGQLPYDVPLPVGLIQDHPEPLLIDRRLIQGGGSIQQAAGKNSQHSTGADESGCGRATRAGDGCASEDSSDGMPVCNAEPMTQEEAEAFDKGSMGSCFLEFGAFGMSQMSREQPAEDSLRTAASQNAAEALQRFQAKGVLSRPSMEENRQMPASGSTDGDPSSNRSSFDTVPAAASSRLQGTTGWGDGSSARDAAIARPAQVRPNSFDAQQLHGRNQQATARPTDAPSSSRAAHQALCVGLPAGRPRLALTQQEIIQTNLQQMQTQQGKRDQAQQQQQQPQRRGTTPVLQQSHMQLSLGMGLGLTLDLGSWRYGMSTGDDAAASQSGSAVTPRASAATHRRRAGAAVEENPAEQVHKEQQPPAQQPPSWPMSMGVAAVSLQNVHSNHLGTALTAADILPSPPKAQAAQEAAQNFAGAVQQEGPQGGNTGPVPGPRPFDDVHGAAAEFSRRNTARAPCKHGGQELSVRHESLERYRDKKRRRMFSSVKTIRYEKRKVNADRRPRLKGRFVKQMDFDNALEMIDEHSQLQPVPDAVMEHASDADCSGDEDEPPARAMHEEDDADAHLV